VIAARHRDFQDAKTKRFEPVCALSIQNAAMLFGTMTVLHWSTNQNAEHVRPAPVATSIATKTKHVRHALSIAVNVSSVETAIVRRASPARIVPKTVVSVRLLSVATKHAKAKRAAKNAQKIAVSAPQFAETVPANSTNPVRHVRKIAEHVQQDAGTTFVRSTNPVKAAHSTAVSALETAVKSSPDLDAMQSWLRNVSAPKTLSAARMCGMESALLK